MDWQSFRLNGVCNAYWQEHRILYGEAISSPYTCTSGSLFWKEGGLKKHLLIDIGFGVWQSVADFFIASGYAHQLEGILITHQHLDHLGELVPFVESWYRLHDGRRPIDLYATQEVREYIANAYPWLLTAKKGKEKLRFNVIEPGLAFSIGKVRILPVDASSHCRGGLNYLFETELARIFVGWDIHEMPKGNIDWRKIDIAFFDGNTFENHPTGHCSIRDLLIWAKEVGLKNMNIVHYSGWEDGHILDPIEREARLWEMLEELACQGLDAGFGFEGQLYEWTSLKRR